MPYKYVAGHVDVSGERLVAPGDVLDEPDQRLIDQGFVIPLADAPSADPVNEEKEPAADATGD